MSVYVDGFNLFHGMKSRSLRRFYWLDLVGLSQALLKPGQHLVRVHYFTARLRDNGRNASDRRRQNTYLDALATRPGLDVQLGYFLEKRDRCRACGATWVRYEEKMSDVNLATQLVLDAADDVFDVALLISGDSDLVPPVRRVRERCPGKRVVVVFPPGRHSAAPKAASHGYLTIGTSKLRQNQLPAEVAVDGTVLRRPASWR